MCPTQLFFISLLLLFIINSSRADNTAPFGYCPSSVCDNGLNISYPFWRLDKYNSASPQYCGYPGFGINCSQTDSILYISDDSFNVTKIDYDNLSLTVVDIDGVDHRGCPRVHHNLTLNDDFPLEYSKLDLYLNFYYNCTVSLPDSAYPLDCLTSRGNNSYFYVGGHEPEDLKWYGICEKKVVVPVMDGGFNRGVGTAIGEGFVLDWQIAKECRKCEASEGRCGYHNSKHESLCFCNDGTIKFDTCESQGAFPFFPVLREAERDSGRPHQTGKTRIRYFINHHPPEAEPRISSRESPNCSRATLLSKLFQLLDAQKQPIPLYDDSVTFDTLHLVAPLYASVSGRNRLGLKVAIGFIAAAGTTVVACGLMCCLRSRKTNKMPKKEDHNVEAFQRQYGSLASTAYSYSDIKKMTNSFKEKIGEGGYGGVYKGNLNGHPVAVKILKETKGNGEEFINEVASISRTSHVNIVTLLGFCLNRKEKALIYEFMPNGSLDKHIYNQDSNMGWELLYKIALGIARGLEYLHRGCNSRILHFDIKPHNILLDEDFCPKISDFGLAKLSTRKESIMSTLEARGTIGYIAPEVFSRNFGGVSHKSDVYSYGMMVLEMVGGRKNYSAERSHNSEIYFPRWAYQRILLDEELIIRDTMINEEEEIAKKMILVGLWCIQTDPLQRPAIGKVIEMLEGSLEVMQMPPKPFICSPSQSEGSTLERPTKPLLFSTLSSTLESTDSTIVQFEE
ncbi:hypothetical protein MTR67_051214 [Solanum verrucosum]|uniref:non-specific serine/threonine protein kinase n=2 Tax=Solanum TaxID=4107 RepID=A0AAF1A2J9_SOLVR|nr:hypothetical protein MTR67_051214 [Solanum verrucosum]